MRILVVEDDRTIASFVVAGLRQAGFAVDHAVNAEAALELTQTEPYDAAIVDIMLPGMDGRRRLPDEAVRVRGGARSRCSLSAPARRRRPPGTSS